MTHVNAIGNIIGRTGRDMRHQNNLTPEEILSRVKQNGYEMDPGTLTEIANVLPALIHNWDDDITAIIYGSTNSGKTKLQARLLHDKLASELKMEIDGELVNLLEDADQADKSEYIVRVRFKKDVTFFDSPGFESDDPKLANMSRAFAKLKQQGPPAHRVSEIKLVDTAIQPLSVQHIPIEDLENQYPLQNPIALYCMDPTLTPFSPAQQEAKRNDILALHEIYGEQLIIVCPFKDKFDAWDEKKRDRRKEILDYALATDVLGCNAIACSSTTGDGLSNVVKRIFAVSGADTSKISEYIKDELRGSRFQHALSNLSKLIAGGLIRNFYNEAMPYSDLFDRLIIISGVYLQEIYSVDEETWKKCNGKIENIMMSPDLEQLETNVVARKAKGFWERFLSVFGKKFSTTEYTASLALIEHICVELYELIHTLEGIKSEPIEAKRLEQWFAEAFAARNLQDAIQRRDVIKAQIQLESAWTEFFATFHSEALDVVTQMSAEKEEKQ